MKYRPEIDGLRALAVVPVILFHAGFELFSGGFVGVDVFFVISGYLITTIIIEDIENKCFSIVNFYERRARRILPALLFVMLACIPFAWIWMLPSQMKDFSASIFSVSVFLSNLYFMSQINYFAPYAELNPLLHTWSLSVEEQFYLFFPPLLLFLLKPGRRFAIIGIFLFAASSLIFSELAWRENQARNFFFSLGRIWEIFAGSIAAFIVQRRGVQNNNFIAILGLAAIVFSIFAYDESIPFPSFYALVPVLGVFFIVLYANKETIAARVLSTKAFVGIGLISYSTYLWHQPLFAFARIKSASEPSHLLMFLLAICSLGLAYLSWRYIEIPFRNKAKVDRNKIFFTSLFCLVLFAGFGFIGYKTNGYPDREWLSVFADLSYDNSSLGYAKCNDELDTVEPKLHYCLKANEKVSHILLGDSHADDKFHGLVQNSLHNEWMLIGHPSCPPLMNVNVESINGTECTERLNKIFNFFNEHEDISTVVISFSHIYPLSNFIAADHIRRKYKASDIVLEDRVGNATTPIDVFEVGLRRTIEYLRNKRINIVILTDIPELEFMPEYCLVNKVSCEFNRADVMKRQEVHRALLGKITRDTEGVRVFESLNLFCKDGSELCSILNDGRTLYRDSHHLSLYGSIEYGKGLAAFLDDLN